MSLLLVAHYIITLAHCVVVCCPLTRQRVTHELVKPAHELVIGGPLHCALAHFSVICCSSICYLLLLYVYTMRGKKVFRNIERRDSHEFESELACINRARHQRKRRERVKERKRD